MAEGALEREAGEVVEALNLLGVLATPQLHARWCEQAPAAELHAVLRARLEALAAFCERARGSEDAARFRGAAPRVRAFAEEVAHTRPTHLSSSSPWTAMARECLQLLGLSLPAEESL